MISLAVSFTGTRDGMTQAQKKTVRLLLVFLLNRHYSTAHHGVCIGSDEDFHNIAKPLGYYIIGHPGVRVDGKCFTRSRVKCDELYPESLYLRRDLEMVRLSNLLIATPNSEVEKERSGTWTTIRYSKEEENKVRYIVFPNGELKFEKNEKR